MQVFLDRRLENEFEKVYRKFKSIETKENEAYQKDLDYLTKKLQIFDPLPSIYNKENFNVAAIDGSGAEGLISLNDIAIHFLTAAFAADRTDFLNGTTKQLDIEPTLCTHPDGVTRLVLLREDKNDEVWEDFKSFINFNYGEKLEAIIDKIIKDIVIETFKEKKPGDPLPPLNRKGFITQIAKGLGLKLSYAEDKKVESWLVSPRSPAQRGWFEQFREVLEYSLAHALLKTNTHFKYIFLDGSMNMLMSPGQIQPRLAANYLLRDLCLKSLKKNTCTVAVSKTTTFPFIYRLASDLEKKLGGEKKWFVRIPNKKREKYALSVLKDRPHIPPKYGVTYLFHFSSEVPILRIDFDEKWWKENIENKDKKKETAKEIELFQEIDWLARDVRYIGYFFGLAFAHTSTVVRFPDRDIVAQKLIDYFAEKGENPKMFIHPRKRLGLM
ncbi:MAG: hypothetical protein ACTSRO_07195 [Candidatus Heimdallarchaeaceae archaeon]